MQWKSSWRNCARPEGRTGSPELKVTEPTIGLRREIGDAETMKGMAKLVGEARGKVFP